METMSTKRDHFTILKKQMEQGGKYEVSYTSCAHDFGDIDINKATYMLVTDLETMNTKSFKLLKNYKHMDINWVYSKLNPKNTYLKIYRLVYDFLHKNGYTGIAVYPTSYGIGVDTFCNNKEFKNRNEMIQGLLKKHNLAYSVEYSDAGWVYRYRISKSKDNINRLKSL